MRTPGRSTLTVSVTGCCARTPAPVTAVRRRAERSAPDRKNARIGYPLAGIAGLNGPPYNRGAHSGGALTTVPVLQVREISKRFPGVVALDAVALDVRAGEVVALAGENGAGKSTLMKILAGLYRPDGGEIRIDDVPVTIHSPADAARFGIGVIHQELEVVETLDVAANICLGRESTWGGPLRLLDRRRMEATASAPSPGSASRYAGTALRIPACMCARWGLSWRRPSPHLS